MTTKRISYIDMAKGIGILLVVFGHSSFPTPEVNQWISSFHMPLFFLLSGILLAHTNAHEQSLRTLIKKKARTILIPYFSFSILSILFTAILDTASFGTYLPNALMQMLVFYGISVLWFLPALFFGEIIFLFVRKHCTPAITALISALICLLAVFIVNTYHYHYLIDFESYLSLLGAYLISVVVRTGFAVTFLALGYFCYLLFLKKEHHTVLYLVLACLFLALNIYLAFKNGSVDLNNMVFHDYRLYFPAAFCGGMFVICLCAALPTIKPLMLAGKHSLIIMATHMNCRFLGICYAVSNLAVSLLPFLGNTGYMVTCILSMILLETIAIYTINRYFPFLIGNAPRR
ncbi:MAG: acyltransferase family protein [Roseburia sp.]|nr:acyltransferase family protein [Roseburia sp.]